MSVLRMLAAAALALCASSAQAVGHLADVMIVDRAAGRSLPVHWHDGRAYVVGRPGAEYQVVVRSNVGEDLLAVVSVDGVDVLGGETASPQRGGYVIGPFARLAIRGWRKSLDETASFYFTSLGDSFASRTGRPTNVGVIGVALFRRAAPRGRPWMGEIAPPFAGSPLEKDAQDAQAPKRAFGAPAAPLGTGHGRRETSPVHEVEFERATDQPEEVIAIYYDSHRNLVAQGVIGVPPAPRDPDPFPTRFVPDPPRYRLN